jgi:hypothetical protein
VDAGDEVEEVARRDNETRVRAGVALAYLGIVDCTVGRREA